VPLIDQAGHAGVLQLLGEPAEAEKEEAEAESEGGGEGGGAPLTPPFQAAGLRWLSSAAAHELALQLGPAVAQLTSTARSAAIAQQARKAPAVLPAELLRGAGLADLVRTWLQQGGSADACREGRRGSLLHLAAADGDEGCAEALLEAGAAIEASDDDGRTPLLTAAMNGRPGVVSALLRAGARREARDTGGRSALQLAEEGGHAAVAVLLRGGKRAAAASKQVAVKDAGKERGKEGGTEGGKGARRGGKPARKGDAAASGGERAASPVKPHPAEKPPSAAAVPARSAPPPELITRLGGPDGKQPEVDSEWEEGLAAWLSAGGAVDNVEPMTGRNLLMFAAQEGQQRAVASLIGAKATPNVVSAAGAVPGGRPGCSPLLLAAAGGHSRVMQLLLEAKATPDPPPLSASGNVGWSALHAAVDLGSAACVRLLLAAGARTDILHPQSGAAPISAALANGNVTCAMLLEHPNRAGIKAALV